MSKKNIATKVLAGVLLLAVLVVCAIPAVLGKYVISASGRGSLSRLSGQFVDFDVTMLAVANYKEVFSKGDTYDRGESFVAVVAFTDGTTKDVTNEVQISGFDSATAGVKIMTAAYTYPETGKTVTTTYEVRVMAPVRITVEAKKTIFNVGERLNASNFSVKAIDNTGAATIVSSFSISSVNMNTVGVKTVTITDRTNNLSATCTIEVLNLTVLDDTAQEHTMYWMTPSNFDVSGWAHLSGGQGYWSYVGKTYTAPNGETVTDFSYSQTAGKDFEANSSSPTGYVFLKDEARYGLTVKDALPYTTLGINCFVGYDAPVVAFGYYLDDDWSTFGYSAAVQLKPAEKFGGVLDPNNKDDYLCDILFGPNPAAAVLTFTLYDLEPGTTHTVHWVVMFEDGVQRVSDWTVTLKEASSSDASFTDTDKPNVNVLLLAGQSNMFGPSPLTQTIRNQYTGADFSNVYIRYNNLNFPNANDATTLKTYFSNSGFDMYTLGIGGQGNTYFGPELGIAEYLSTSANASDEQWYLIKYAPAGTVLASQWNSPCTVNGKTTSLINDMLAYCEESIALLTDDYDVQVRSFLWMQGESDATVASWANDYAENERMLVSRVREAMAAYATRPVGTIPGSGISFVSASIAHNVSGKTAAEGGTNDWVYANTVNNGKYLNCQIWYLPTVSVTGSVFSPGIAAGVYNNVTSPAQGLEYIYNSIYIDTAALVSKAQATDEHAEYASSSDTTDWAHYSALSMKNLGFWFAVAADYMRMTI